MKTHRCPYDGHYCNNASCDRCYTYQSGNGCRGIVNALILLGIMILMIVLFTSCDVPKREVTTKNYSVDQITVDGVKYLIVTSNGTITIIKHEPGAIKE